MFVLEMYSDNIDKNILSLGHWGSVQRIPQTACLISQVLSKSVSKTRSKLYPVSDKQIKENIIIMEKQIYLHQK